jgi:uncharacterized membrane protein
MVSYAMGDSDQTFLGTLSDAIFYFTAWIGMAIGGTFGAFAVL